LSFRVILVLSEIPRVRFHPRFVTSGCCYITPHKISTIT
jgi:hypothetical protein